MTGASAGTEPSAKGPEYAVPALDKALDILEVLAGRRDGMSQVEIAGAVERSPSQIFRVLTTLERRGYLFRERQTGLYSLSLRLFDLAHRQEPLRALTAAALAPMRRLADETGQSCNLSVLDVDRVRVVAQAESPGDFGFRVRVGATFSVEETATGAVLRAFGGVAAGDGGDRGAGEDVARAGGSGDAREDVARGEGIDDGKVGAGIRERGFLERADAVQPSITDVVFPVLGASGRAVAALTVPYVATSYSAVSAERVREAAGRAAAEISASLGS
ncbi:helix-turn-helix domain-containing protein [Herbiconiux sp. CPCC 205716]|uniref:Helix-turn-helix domain-containing protein n=1 Tax=Herbiconiux gentiana TaxID=2970912 RepID=A0ABT2GJ62_9MICO|nr:helix-turn-helix domain-containing protein [Herbiconiux gentiana]MCS5716249.1 helix-turn-helix domain-containing protein [Herbiconiux gentiana]